MMRISRPRAVAAAALFLVAPASPALSGDTDARILDEAKALFRVELAGAPAPRRCEYWSIWYSNDGESLKAIGATPVPLPASLPPPRAVFDLQGADASAFCDMEEQGLYRNGLTKKLDAAHPNGLSFPGRYYSFPVFDTSFTIASLVVSMDNHQAMWSKRGGKYLIESWALTSEIYVKKDGTWRKFLVMPVSDNEIFYPDDAGSGGSAR